MNASPQIKNALVIAFLLETLCVTYTFYFPSFAAPISVLYTAAGLVMGVGFLWINHKKAMVPHTLFSLQQPFTRFNWLLTIILFVVSCHFTMKWMADSPLNYKEADMLPVIKIMSERAVAGNWARVYDMIPEIWGGMRPIYLPAMWLPFCLPVLLHIDVRWLTAIALFISFCIFLWKINPFQKRAVPVLFCVFLLFWWIFTEENCGIITYTEEGIVILYYVLLTLALNTRKAWLIGICVSLCILSRFALVGWIPAMLLFFVYGKEWKQLIQFIAAGVACFVLLVLAPVGLRAFISLLGLPSDYIAFAERVWHDAPHVFREGLGFAKFFGPERIATLHYTLIALSFSVPVLFMFLALRLQKQFGFSRQHIPLATLKITLVVFFNFIDVPYQYLFYTASFVSLAGMVYLVMDGEEAKEMSLQG